MIEIMLKVLEALVGVAALWVMGRIAASKRPQIMRDSLAYITARAASLALAAMKDVEAAKDPSKPGTWDDATKAKIKADVIAQLMETGGTMLRIFQLSLSHPDQLTAQIDAIVEGEVQRLKMGPSLAQVETTRKIHVPSVMTRAMVGLLAFAMLAMAGCGAPVTIGATGGVQPGSSGGWDVTAGISITIGRVAASAVQTAVAGVQMPDATRAVLTRSLALVNDGLLEASDALNTYEASKTADAACRVRNVMDMLVNNLLDLLPLLRDAGVVVPPEVTAAAGQLGALVDLFEPVCLADAGAGRLHPPSATARVAAALAHQH